MNTTESVRSVTIVEPGSDPERTAPPAPLTGSGLGNTPKSSQPSSPADCNKVASTASGAAAKRDPGPSVSTAVPTSRLGIAGGADAFGSVTSERSAT
jgi:hypothetical protein